MLELMQRLRRGSGRRGRRFGGSLQPLVLLSALGLVLYSALWVSPLVTGGRSPAVLSSGGPGTACIAWRHTLACSPFGARVPGGDRSCDTVIAKDAGFCECSGGWTTHRKTCGYHKPYTCAAACAQLRFDEHEALQYPAPLNCEGQDPYMAQKYIRHDNDSWAAAEAELMAASGGGSARRLTAHQLHGRINSSTAQGSVPMRARGQRRLVATLSPLSAAQQQRDQQRAALWAQVQQALLTAGPHTVDPPAVRTNRDDFVRSGLRMNPKDVQRAREQWQAFLAAAPAYPQDRFASRGIVVLSGSLPYMVPAWVGVHMLRMTGCQLPVEMFFPRKELPSVGLQAVLARLGVEVQTLPPAVAALAGFTMKAATLLLSSFEEVMFLDADNIAVQDPTSLFESPGYVSAGALLWPDYWASSAAPDLAAVLGLQSLPGGTFESGQMIIHKRRHWQGVLLAAFFNIQSKLYYELLSNFMGKGDKETFAYALLATNGSYACIQKPVGSVGINKMHCNKHQTNCWHEFAGNTMTQHDEQGELAFLHANFRPKMDLALPAAWEAYTRRWQLLQPGGAPFADIISQLHRDIEHEAFQMLVHFRCAPFLSDYIRALGAKPPPPLFGFHPIHNGMDFRRPYRWGMLGDYLQFTKVSLGDKWKHFKNTRLRRLFHKH